MKAVIMAGGFGTRLRPLTINTPKPLVPVLGLPMMEHIVRLLAKNGLTDIVSLLYFQADKIREYFGDGSQFGVRMSYAQPTEDYGTAGAVRFALGDSDETALIISGDLVTDFNLIEAIEWHRQRKADATLLLTRMENPIAYGIVITDDDGNITRFLEKPTWGEAFSDTINTGIYVLEPNAVQLIPPKSNFDFSQDLFPSMLTQKMGLFGKIMSGYWKDVGNVDEYHLAHIDFFNNALHLDLDRRFEVAPGGNLIKGKNVKIGDNVKLSGRVVLGDEVLIDAGARLHNCVVGHRSRVGSACEIENSIIWEDSLIRQESVMHSAIVCSRTELGRNVQLLDKAIISDDCVIGESATVKANCKIWPGKTVDSGATVSSSLVWGEKWNRELFNDSKISGLALTEITPEMAVKIGAAFGAFVGQGQAVVVSRDASDTSRLLKRGLLSGLLAAGVNVSDLEALSIPVVRFALSRGSYAAGIYIRHSPYDFRQIDLIFCDGSGLDMPTGKLKKVERMYYGEDFERASLDQIGHLEMPQRVLEDYRMKFMDEVDIPMIKKAGFKIVIDHSNGSSSQVFPTLFSTLGISATELNANLNPRRLSSSPEESARALVQLSSIVLSLNADVGFLLNSASEKLAIVDEFGRPISNQTLLLIMTDLFLQTHPASKIAVPVGASMGIDDIAADYGVEVVRVAGDHLSMMEIHRRGEVQFVGGTRGGFIFPGFQSGADGMLATIKLLQMLAATHSKINEIVRKYDRFVRKTATVPCPWSRKGTVLRKLISSSTGKKRQMIDGVRIFENGGWVLVAPDRLKAAFNIEVESFSKEDTARLLEQYREFVESSQ